MIDGDNIVRLPAVYVIFSSMEPEHNAWLVITRGIIQDQATGFYCREAPCTVGLLDVYIISTEMIFDTNRGNRWGSAKNSLISHNEPVHYIILIIHVWQDIRVRDKGTRAGKENTIAGTWRAAIIRRWKMAVSATESNQHINNDVPTTFFQAVGAWSL